MILGTILAGLRWVGSGLLDLLHLIPREWMDRLITLMLGGVIAWSWCYVHYNIPALKADRAALKVLQAAQAESHKVALERERAAEQAGWRAGYDAGISFQDIAARISPTILKVPYYVSQKDDAACPVPWGFVRVWDAITTGADIDSVRARVAPGQPDDARSDVTLSEIVALYGTAATRAHQNADQLNRLAGFEKAAADIAGHD